MGYGEIITDNLQLRNALVQIVMRLLAGERDIVEAVAHIALGRSPSEVSTKFNINKWRLKGVIVRIKSACGLFGWEKAFLKAYNMVIDKVQPIIHYSKYPTCMLCGKIIYYSPSQHVIISHKDLVYKLVDEAINGGDLI